MEDLPVYTIGIVVVVVLLLIAGIAFYLGTLVFKGIIKTPGKLVEHTSDGVGKGLSALSGGIGDSVEKLASGTGNAATALSQSAGDSLEYLAEKGGLAAEKLAKSTQKVVGYLCGVRDDEDPEIARRVVVSYRMACSSTQNINEWATASKEIEVTHDYSFQSLSLPSILGKLTEATIKQSERYVVKAGISLESICVEMPQEESDKEIIYHIPKATILSCTPVEGSFQNHTSKNIWHAISDDRRASAREELLKAAKEMACATDVLVIAENNVRDLLLKKHKELPELKDYKGIVRYDSLPTALNLLESPEKN